MVKGPVFFRSQSGIAAVNELLMAKLLEDFGFQRLHGFLFILISGKQGESQRDSIPIGKQPHLDDGVRFVVLAFSVFSITVLLLNLEIVV